MRKSGKPDLRGANPPYESRVREGDMTRQILLAAAGAAMLAAPALAQSPGIPGVLAPGVEVELVQEGFVFTAGPLGVTLTRAGKPLTVDAPIGPAVFAYEVQSDGTVKNKRTFAQLRDIPEGKESGADGLALDNEGRLYITTLPGVQVFDAGGQYLGTIKVPRQSANVAFAGPDKRTLYITAREGLYRV